MILTHNTTIKLFYYNGNNRCNNYKIFVRRCYCNNKKVVAGRRNKLRGNRFTQQKNLVAINPKHSKLYTFGVNTVPKTM